MDPLDFLTDEELLLLFHRRKTEISCIEQPHTLLNQLRDNDLIPEDKYQKVIRAKAKHTMARHVYDYLDWLEKNQPQTIKQFWSCVFKEHILQQYPALLFMRKELLGGSITVINKLPDKEEKMQVEEREKKKVEDRHTSEGKAVRKRKHKEEESAEEEEPGPSSLQATPRHKRTPSRPTFRTPLKGNKMDIWNWPMYKVSLPVSCGDKEGTLDRKKLARGEKCILAGEQWFLPTEFEAFGGKKTCKNWKTSIRCKDIPLQRLIQDGILKHSKCKPQRSKTSQKGKGRKELLSSDESEITVSDSEEDEDTEEEEPEGVSEEEGEEGDGDAESHADVDLSAFADASLPVTCGSARGILQKDRFATGTSGKCIRTEDKWLTPMEFLKEDPKLIDPHWKISIRCLGEPLKYLLEKQVLRVHSLLCVCRLCSNDEHDLFAQENDDYCFICNNDGDLLCCDECPRAFHYGCHIPSVDQNTLGDRWMCTYCVLCTSQKWRYPCQISRQKVLQSGISDYLLHCQYLLLCLYKEDKQSVFKGDPRRTVKDYAKFIKKPMWMDLIVNKLQEKEYSTVGQFVSDIQLIFNNCATFNQGNEFGKMGSKLSDLFEEEFLKCFNILAGNDC